jgi:hypothetical protein
MADHPGTGRREALCGGISSRRSWFGALQTGAASAPRTVLRGKLRLVSGSLVHRHALACTCVTARDGRRSQKGTRRRGSAVRAEKRVGAFRHWAQSRERAASIAFVVVERHLASLSDGAHPIGLLEPIGCHLHRNFYTSSESGTSIEPSKNFCGPAALGLMSKSKISVGSHNVAQAFGMSTTPEICP